MDTTCVSRTLCATLYNTCSQLRSSSSRTFAPEDECRGSSVGNFLRRLRIPPASLAPYAAPSHRFVKFARRLPEVCGGRVTEPMQSQCMNGSPQPGLQIASEHIHGKSGAFVSPRLPGRQVESNVVVMTGDFGVRVVVVKKSHQTWRHWFLWLGKVGDRWNFSKTSTLPLFAMTASY